MASKSKSKKSLIVFLDSSVILSGLSSPTGGSRKLLDAGRGGKIWLTTTPLIIEEVAEHLDKLQIKPQDLEDLLVSKTLHLAENPQGEMIQKFGRVATDPDDAHVLAGTVLSGSGVLVTLDKKHLITPKVKRILKPIHVFSAKEFWSWLGRSMSERQ